MSVFSLLEIRSVSSLCPRLRLLPRSVSSKSSSGSEESEALGVDFSDEGLLTDLVVLSRRPDVPDDEDECWDWELVARALEDRRGDGGAIEEIGLEGSAAGSEKSRGNQRSQTCWSRRKDVRS